MKSNKVVNTQISNGDLFEISFKEARFVSGDDGEILEGNQISWLNPRLIQEGQDFIQKHKFSINLAHTFTIVLGVSFKNAASVLLRTENFEDTERSMKRLLEMEEHVFKWFESPILTEMDKGFRDIQFVRKIHAQALKKCFRATIDISKNVSDQERKEKLLAAIQNDLSCVQIPESLEGLLTYYPSMLMSQFDMALTQFGFFSFVYLFPDMLGIKDTTGMEGFMHLWAIFGRLLGIQDRYNIALQGDRELFVKLFKNIIVGSLKTADLTLITLQDDLSSALATMTGFLDLKSTIYFALSSVERITPEYNYSGENVYNLMSWGEVIYLELWQLTIFLMFHFDFLRESLNGAMKAFINFQRKSVLGIKLQSRKS